MVTVSSAYLWVNLALWVLVVSVNLAALFRKVRQQGEGSK